MKSLLRWGLVVAGLAAFYSAAVAGPMYTSLKLYVGQKNWERAARVGPRAIEEAPDKADAYCKYGIALAELDSVRLAGEMFTTAVELARKQNDADVLKEIEGSRDHYFALNFNQGVAMISGGNDLVDSLGNRADTSRNDVKAVLAVASQKFQRALAAFEKAVMLKPGDAKSWSQKGLALSYLHRDDEALACYNKALEIDPNYKIARENKKTAMIRAAEAFKAQKKWDAAASQFEELFAMGDTASLLDLGDCFFNKGKAAPDTATQLPQLRKSASCYGQYSSLYPADTLASYNYAVALMNALQYAQAEPIVKGFVARNPLAPDKHMLLKEIYNGRKDNQGAIAEMTAFEALTRGKETDGALVRPGPNSEAAKVVARMGKPERVFSFTSDKFITSVWFYLARGQLFAFIADKQIGQSSWGH